MVGDYVYILHVNDKAPMVLPRNHIFFHLPTNQSSPATHFRTRSRLSKIHYQKGRIIVHKDPALMPERKEDWRTFNIREDGPKAGVKLRTNIHVSCRDVTHADTHTHTCVQYVLARITEAMS